MRFCEASAKDNFNVDEIFLKLVDDILKKVKRENRTSWKRFIWNLFIASFAVFWLGNFYVEGETRGVIVRLKTKGARTRPKEPARCRDSLSPRP